MSRCFEQFEIMEENDECFTLRLQRLPEQPFHLSVGARRYLCMPQRLGYRCGRPSWDIVDAIALSRLYKHDFRDDIAFRPKHAGIIAAVESDAIAGEAPAIPVKAEVFL